MVQSCCVSKSKVVTVIILSSISLAHWLLLGHCANAVHTVLAIWSPGWSNPTCQHAQRGQTDGKSRSWGVWIVPAVYLSVVVPAAQQTMQLSGWWKVLLSPYNPHIQQHHPGRGWGEAPCSLWSFCLVLVLLVFVHVFSLMSWALVVTEETPRLLPVECDTLSKKDLITVH